MIEETEDPTTWITARDGTTIFYENTDGRRWSMSGICIACGACEQIPDPLVIGSSQTDINIRRLADGSNQEWARTITWHGEPGTENACLEDNFALRKDIPITPDGIRPNCTLIGQWIE
jgi:hypothetical protein